MRNAKFRTSLANNIFMSIFAIFICSSLILFDDVINFNFIFPLVSALVVIVIIVLNNGTYIVKKEDQLIYVRSYKVCEEISLINNHYYYNRQQELVFYSKDKEETIVIPLGFISKKKREEILVMVNDYSVNKGIKETKVVVH